MVELRRGTRDAVGPDGTPVVGRGYEVCDEAGSPLEPEQLRPAAFEDIAVVQAAATTAEERVALRTAAFGVGRPVTLRPDERGVALLDGDGRVQAGRVDRSVADATRDLLGRVESLHAWVCWEWLRDDGRSGVEVALSSGELRPQRLGPPQPSSAARALLADRRVWLGIAAVVVIVLVVLAVRG